MEDFSGILIGLSGSIIALVVFFCAGAREEIKLLILDLIGIERPPINVNKSPKKRKIQVGVEDDKGFTQEKQEIGTPVNNKKDLPEGVNKKDIESKIEIKPEIQVIPEKTNIPKEPTKSFVKKLKGKYE